MKDKVFYCLNINIPNPPPPLLLKKWALSKTLKQFVRILAFGPFIPLDFYSIIFLNSIIVSNYDVWYDTYKPHNYSIPVLLSMSKCFLSAIFTPTFAKKSSSTFWLVSCWTSLPWLLGFHTFQKLHATRDHSTPERSMFIIWLRQKTGHILAYLKAKLMKHVIKYGSFLVKEYIIMTNLPTLDSQTM